MAVDFQSDIFPILESHCIRCHGPELQEGKLRLDTLSIDLINDRSATENWHEVLNVLDAGEMPPEGEPRLDAGQHERLTAWLSTSLKEALHLQRRTDGRVVIRRLNRAEYQYTMQDLIGLDMDYVRDIPPDAVSSDGFLNDGRSLQMSPLQLECYLATARVAFNHVIVTGDKPNAYDHTFTECKIDTWLGNAERSNRLGRQQEFLAKIVNDYPDAGEFLVRVKFSAEIKPNIGFPLLEVSVGYQPDTEILLDNFDVVEVTTSGTQTLEFRGRLEGFPLPVRGQGKYPGLVVRVRNVYNDQSPLPAEQKDSAGKTIYPDEPHLPTLTIQSVEFQGNSYEQWPPATHRQILFEATDGEPESDAYVIEVLKRFMTRAFRRNVDDSEVERLLGFYQSIRPDFPTFVEAIRETLAMVLIQPEFLYRIEPSSVDKRQVTDIELASRLSYFLWSTMPDEHLMELASAGKLHEPGNLIQEVNRMLADRRSQRLVEQFTDQWLGLNMIDNVAVSRDRFPRFDDKLKQEMCGETRAFVGELLRENLSVMNLIQSDFTMLNEPLARHYGINDVFGRGFQRVPLGVTSHRGGLLAQASVLLVNSTGSDSHPVRRAVWIRDRLLNDPPAPPPPNVPSLDDKDPKFHELSVREQMEIHRAQESCDRCHRNIDPWGIALECFDAVGNWRTEVPRKVFDEVRMFAVETTSKLPDGHEMVGIEGLQSYLLNERKHEFATSIVARLLTYAMGRKLELTDQEVVNEITAQFASNDYELKSLIHLIVASEPFQGK